MKLYSIRDSKAVRFNAPVAFINDADANRAFQRAVKSSQSVLSDYPEDYELWFVADFDEVTGIFEATTPRFVANAEPRDVSRAEILADPQLEPVKLSKEAMPE